MPSIFLIYNQPTACDRLVTGLDMINLLITSLLDLPKLFLPERDRAGARIELLLAMTLVRRAFQLRRSYARA